MFVHLFSQTKSKAANQRNIFWNNFLLMLAEPVLVKVFYIYSVFITGGVGHNFPVECHKIMTTQLPWPLTCIVNNIVNQ